MPLLSEQSRRKRNLIVISGLLLVAVLFTVFNLEMRAPELPVASNLVVLALINVNLIVLALLVLLLLRNLIKLWGERRQGLIGAKFKTKLVFAFLSLALVPAALIFVVASNFISKSIEGWFKPQVERPLDQALAVASTYYHNLEGTALRHATHIGRVVDREGLLTEDRREALASYLVEQQDQLGVSTITVYNGRRQELVRVKDPGLSELPTGEVNENQLKRGLGGQEITTVRELSSGDLIEAVAPIWSRAPARQVVGAVVVGLHVSERLEAKIRGISQSFQDYKQLKLLKTPIKTIYTQLFLLMTLIIVFSFTWFGFYLARGITGPIEQLAEGTREVAAGNLRYKVKARADDEIGALVDSFNHMTDDLLQSKQRLEEAYLDLQDKHTELEDRRRYTETVLEAITTGVVSIDPAGRLTTINRAGARMFGLNAAQSVGHALDEVFLGSEVGEVLALVHRCRRTRAGSVEQELHLRRNGSRLSLLASATALRGPDGEYAGAVIVFDDLTELLRAQRLAAWREVAQRIAHEIKNPLTPIQLSAQRLRRRLTRTSGQDQELVTECTETIIQEVDGLKRLVDEFSRFARMPALAPRPTDVRPLVESVATLYRESHPALALATHYGDDVPLVEVDPDQFKRAVLNLVDNAVAAVGGAGDVDVEVATAEPARVRVVVSDTGPGITAENKERLFQPYFSTKTAGMGLGLPIVHEIVTEHGGTIRVEDNVPRGTRFIMELPVSRATAPVEA
ncbi:MAG: HAMP domain-containing protein [Candidatus Rokubacteria bacterium]|nr:HAMP domain-containing protein [Candidatus Rokubacteria bacterium]MBI3826792.1 HAMP domain-containing protein [Candidatus Rokubacteria bacterium]